MSVSNYSSVPVVGSPSRTESWALTEAARRITMALDALAKADELTLPAAKRNIRDNIRLNWRLWTIFQAELTLDTNATPADVRQNMLTLCQFVDNHTIECMSNIEPAQIQILIDINRNIAQGLLEGLSNEQKNDAKKDKANQSTVESPGSFNTSA